MDSLTSVTDKYIASLEPKRKLQLQQVPPEVKQSIENYTKSLKQVGAQTHVHTFVDAVHVFIKLGDDPARAVLRP